MKSVTENAEAKAQAELRQIAGEIRDYQGAAGLSDSEFVRKFAGLGSTKTYTRILAGEVAELDLDRWLLEYQQVKSLIDALGAGSGDEEALYDDLTPCIKLRAAVVEAMKERGNNRLVIVQGPSGSGKTHAALALEARYGARIRRAEADETWKESLMAVLGGLLRASNVKELPVTAGARLEKLIATLNQSRVCFIVDEAHHLGPRTLNLIKTLINQTPCEFVLLAMDTLLKRLEMAAYEEARQLTGNRLCERIRLNGSEPSDLEKFLGRRLEWESGELKKATAAVMAKAGLYGNFAFLKIAVRQARRLAADEKVTLDTFTKAMFRAAATR